MFRLILAFAVALSHIGVTAFGMNPGVIAVVCFYMVSGYVMTGLIRRHFAALDRIGAFYLDRAIRLLPAYFTVAAMTAAWLFVYRQPTLFLRTSPSWIDLLNNVTIVPLNYYMFNQADRFMLIPPAWSLGAEVQFYILIPFILLTRLRWLFFAGSLAIYGLSLLEILQPEWYGYRLVAGVLFMFLIGSFLFDVRASQHLNKAIMLIAGTVIITAIAIHMAGVLNVPFKRETLLGLLIGTTTIASCGRLARKKWDEFAGDLSYGVFLWHFFVVWCFFNSKPISSLIDIALFVVAVSALAMLSLFLVERPALRLRASLRTKERAANAQLPGA